MKISKKLVSSDFKNHRVEDPTKISSRQEKQVKKYVKEYFDKAVAKKREHEKKKAERRSKEGESAASPTPALGAKVRKEEESDGDQDMAMSDDDESEKPKLSTTPATPSDLLSQVEGLKRKRLNDEDPESIKFGDNGATPSKRLKSESPPPPPPPPPDSMSFFNEGMDDGDRHGYETNTFAGDTESPGVSPENDSDALPHHTAFSNSTRAAKDDLDILGNAHTPDIRSDEEYKEHEGLFAGNGQRHLSDIEVHGAA